MPGVVIATQLAQRGLVQLKQDVTQQGRIRITGCEALAVDLAQRTHQRVAVLLADRAILVPMAAIQAGFLHVSLPMQRLRAWRERAPKRVDWQRCGAGATRPVPRTRGIRDDLATRS